MEKLLGAFLWMQFAWVNGQQLDQSPQSVIIKEGENFIMNCTSPSSLYSIHWYKQKPGEGPDFLTMMFSGGETNKGKFTVSFDNNKQFSSLFIIMAQPADSGTYLCAAPLIFGNGTQLEVMPEMQETSLPSKIFVMKNGTNAACLVKDFYPKSIAINLYPENNTRQVVTIVNGKFSAVKFGQYTQDLENITCTVQYKNQTIMTSYKKSNVNSTDKSTDTEEPTDLSSIQDCLKPSVKIENINLLSITLLGLRVLLAKSVAVNFFLTIKCFLI
nr:T cell receptor delta chain [Isoodon macrourus]